MSRLLAVLLALLAALLAVAGPLAVPLRAEEEAPAGGAPSATERPGLTADQLVERLWDHGPARTAFLLVQVGGPILGIVVLVRLWLRRDRIRGGLLPAPAPVAPTTPFLLPQALALLLVWVGGAVLLSNALVSLRPAWKGDLAFTLVLQTAFALPLAALVGLRRLRLSQPAPPGLPRAASVGVRTWWVVLVGVVPVGMLTVLLLKALGHEPTTQDLVGQAVDAETPVAQVLSIACYGVLVAPLLEESLFRGVLYPALRSALGGDRRAVAVAAVATSLLFAAIHGHLPSMLPLTFLALVLAWVMEKTNSLAGVAIAHGLFNLGSLLPMLLLRLG